MSNPPDDGEGPVETGREADKVGYGKPPSETRFRKGNQAARKHGRPPKRQNNATILQGIIDHKVIVPLPGGKKRKMGLWEAGVWQLAVKAAQGANGSWDRLNKLCDKFGVIRPEQPWDDDIASDEEQTIAEYFTSWALSTPAKAAALLARLQEDLRSRVVTTHPSSKGPTARIVDFGYAEGPPFVSRFDRKSA